MQNFNLKTLVINLKTVFSSKNPNICIFVLALFCIKIANASRDILNFYKTIKIAM